MRFPPFDWQSKHKDQPWAECDPEFDIFIDPLYPEQCCQDEFFFCPAAGDTPCEATGEPDVGLPIFPPYYLSSSSSGYSSSSSSNYPSSSSSSNYSSSSSSDPSNSSSSSSSSSGSSGSWNYDYYHHEPADAHDPIDGVWIDEPGVYTFEQTVEGGTVLVATEMNVWFEPWGQTSPIPPNNQTGWDGLTVESAPTNAGPWTELVNTGCLGSASQYNDDYDRSTAYWVGSFILPVGTNAMRITVDAECGDPNGGNDTTSWVVDIEEA